MSSVKRLLLIGGLKFGDFILSIVERYLIQCPLFGVSVREYNGSLTCVSILSQHVDNLNKFVIELGGQGGRGKRNA